MQREMRKVLFTFHYVSIKTSLHTSSAITFPLFTFHYVSIKTVSPEYTALPIVYLHSTMYLLKLNREISVLCCNNHLHSTMYLLKRIPSCCIYTCICNLHSTMYLLKQEKPSLIIPDLKYLHSTMYLLKLLAYTLVLLLSRFTFHYVSIKTWKFINIDFHSNNLHSTMYLLKPFHDQNQLCK